MTEIVFKILIVGDAEVGKTSFVQRYTKDEYPKRYVATLGGQDRFQSISRVYYKKASACIVMFDVNKPHTFLSTIKWKKDLDSKCFLPNGMPIPCILAGNKIDLKPRSVEKEDIKKLCKEHSFIGWTEMSVRDNKHVTETIDFLVGELMLPSHGRTNPLAEEHNQSISLNDDKPEQKHHCCGSE